MKYGWSDVYNDAEWIAQQVTEERFRPVGVYGVPRGGAAPACIIADQLRVPVLDAPAPGSLVVDDICDTGETLARFAGHRTAVLAGRRRADSKATPNYTARWVDEWVEFPWEHAIESDNESLVTRLIEIVGDDPTREDLLETPRRYLSALRELTSGYRTDPAPILARTFASSIDELLVVPNIEFYSLCEHHLLPFYGVVHVGYIPAGRILGLSKFARVVDVFARRLQTQERMTEQIADAINESVQPLGVGVIVRARHLCMAARGAAKQRASFTTSRVLGALRTSGPARDEFLRFLKGS